jgi:hypothetical protein
MVRGLLWLVGFVGSIGSIGLNWLDVLVANGDNKAFRGSRLLERGKIIFSYGIQTYKKREIQKGF